MPYAPVTIKTDAGPGVLTVLGERQNEFPGSSSSRSRSAPTPTARWPRRCSATSARSPNRSSSCAPFRGVQQGTVVGQEGLEYYYDRYLRGEPGVQRVEVNAAGYPVPSKLAADASRVPGTA